MKVQRKMISTMWCPAEKAIYDAMQEVENMEGDVRLTDAVILLEQAQEKVAEYIDEQLRNNVSI